MYQGINYSKIYTLNKILLNLTVTDYFKNSLSESLNFFSGILVSMFQRHVIMKEGESAPFYFFWN